MVDACYKNSSGVGLKGKFGKAIINIINLYFVIHAISFSLNTIYTYVLFFRYFLLGIGENALYNLKLKTLNLLYHDI